MCVHLICKYIKISSWRLTDQILSTPHPVTNFHPELNGSYSSNPNLVAGPRRDRNRHQLNQNTETVSSVWLVPNLVLDGIVFSKKSRIQFGEQNAI